MKNRISYIGTCLYCKREKVKFEETSIEELVVCPFCHFRMGKRLLIKVVEV